MDTMYILRHLLTILLLALVVKANTLPTEQQKRLLLDLHNKYRRMQGSSNMQELTWDDDLSRKAANWVGRCNFEHEQKGYGENLAFNTYPKTDEELITNSMKAWYDEIEDYYYGSRSCGVACHYTQIVWANTRKVGCAFKRCGYLYSSGKPIKNAWYLGCWYDPKGNYINQNPYLKGSACSKCSGQSCNRGLCTGSGSSNDVDGDGKDTESACADLNKYCGYWRSIGECSRNKPYMETNCRKSCGICGGSSCTDLNKSCGWWSTVGECRKNAPYMDINCRKSCGLCGDSACVDLNKNCSAWEAIGECRKNPAYMKVNCRRSCGLCGGR